MFIHYPVVYLPLLSDHWVHTQGTKTPFSWSWRTTFDCGRWAGRETRGNCRTKRKEWNQLEAKNLTPCQCSCHFLSQAYLQYMHRIRSDLEISSTQRGISLLQDRMTKNWETLESTNVPFPKTVQMAVPSLSENWKDMPVTWRMTFARLSSNASSPGH